MRQQAGPRPPSKRRFSRFQPGASYVGRGNHALDVGGARADAPCPVRCAVYYFEATVLDAGERGELSIGLAEASFVSELCVATVLKA